MIRAAIGVLAMLLLPVAAGAGDLVQLRRALAGDDRQAVERWLAAEAAAPVADPLAALGAQPRPERLQEQSGELARQEARLTALAVIYLNSAEAPAIKRRLLGALDAAAAMRQQLARAGAQTVAAAAARPLILTRLFVIAGAPGRKRAEPAIEFSPDEQTLSVRYAYEGGVPGEELSARWIHRTAAGPVEVGRSTTRVQKAIDQGQFSLSPGRPWSDGLYRVEIGGRRGIVGETDFLVQGPQVAAVPPPFPGRPIMTTPAPDATEAIATPALTSAAPGSLVSVLDALFARDVENGEAKEPVTEFSTARRRLVLWARVRASGGGALLARWYATDGGDRLLGEHTLGVPAGESRVAYWLEPAHDKGKFHRGPLRVDLIAGGRVIKSLPLRIRQAGFFDELGEAVEQFGRELEKAIQGERK